MKEFTRTSVLEPARFSFHGLDLSRFIVYVLISLLVAKAVRCERTDTHSLTPWLFKEPQFSDLIVPQCRLSDDAVVILGENRWDYR
jgi:hypothetical protein